MTTADAAAMRSHGRTAAAIDAAGEPPVWLHRAGAVVGVVTPAEALALLTADPRRVTSADLHLPADA